MSITVVHTLAEKEWRRFVDKHPASNIFHTPEMFQVFTQAKGHHPILWAAVGGDGHILALLPIVNVTLLNGPLRYFTTRSIAYGSVLCAPGPKGQEALAILLSTYKRQARSRSLFTELRNLSDFASIQPTLQENNFVYEGHLNFLIDLERPVEEIWSSVRSNVRTNVRKARRKQVVIEEITSLDEVASAYTVLEKVYEHIQVPLAPISLFEAAFEILYSKNMIKFFSAWVDETRIGVAVRLLHKNVIYAWYAGITRDYASHKANDLLNWHVLEWGAQNGFTCFDFGGAGKPDEEYGPRKFKAKFNGALVNYGRNTCVHAPMRLRLGEKVYNAVRKFL